ncbi:hypothetical protein F5Y19DRAFT_411930 [Xylariaceae sp. FL1651]|nr:hypothetical protein F5Y19DRAFT_411930 [Xylariaceae sp. FL1651]
MATTPSGKTIWNDKCRSDLLCAVIDIAPPSTNEWNAIINQLKGKGYSYTYTAALQHLQKLKRKEGPGTAPASTPATPQKPSKGAVATHNKRGTATKRQEPMEDLDDDDDEEENKRPMKKLKHKSQAPNPGQRYENEPAPFKDEI